MLACRPMTEISSTGEEFRESTRAPLETPVILQIDAFSEPQSGYTGNVSVGGMFVRVHDPQPVGTLVRFEVELGGTDSTIRGVAEVAWIRTHAQGPERPAGMGLQFRLIEGDGKERLRAVVMKILDRQGDLPVVQPPRKPTAPRRVEPPSASPAPKTERRQPRRAGGKRVLSKPAPSTSKPEKRDRRSDQGLVRLTPERPNVLAVLVLFTILLFLLMRTCG